MFYKYIQYFYLKNKLSEIFMILTQSFLDNLTLKHLILQRQVFEGSIKLTEISIIAKFESRFKHDRMKFIKSKSRLSSPLYSWNYKRNYELR